MQRRALQSVRQRKIPVCSTMRMKYLKFAETLKANVLVFQQQRPAEEGIYSGGNIPTAEKETERQRLIDVGELKLLGIHHGKCYGGSHWYFVWEHR